MVGSKPLNKAALGVAAILLYTTACRVAWTQLNQGVHFTSDDAALYHLSLWCEAAIASGRNSLWGTTPQFGAPYPTLTGSVSALGYRFIGHGPVEAMLSMLPWYLLADLAAVVSAWRLRGPGAALVAAAVTPLVTMHESTRGNLATEPAVGAMAVATILFLWLGGWLERPGWSTLAGTVAGLGLLSKWSFGFFMGPLCALVIAYSMARAFRGVWGLAVAAATLGAIGSAAAWTAGKIPWDWPVIAAGATALVSGLAAWRGRVPGWHRRMVSVLLFCLMAAAMAAPWYLPNLDMMQQFLGQNLGHEYAGPVMTFPGRLSFYGFELLHGSLGVLLLALLGLGTVRTLLGGRTRSPFALACLVAFTAGFLLLAAAPYTKSRYITAGYALLAPLVVEGMVGTHVAWRVLRVAVIAASLLFLQSGLPAPWNQRAAQALADAQIPGLTPPSGALPSTTGVSAAPPRRSQQVRPVLSLVDTSPNPAAPLARQVVALLAGHPLPKRPQVAVSYPQQLQLREELGVEFAAVHGASNTPLHVAWEGRFPAGLAGAMLLHTSREQLEARHIAALSDCTSVVALAEQGGTLYGRACFPGEAK